jgi:hypothetical protein
MNKKITDKINVWNFIISIVAINLSVLATVKSCFSERELKETNYKITSVEFRPRLKLSNPEINSLSFFSDTIPLKQPNDIYDSILDVKGRIKLWLRIKVTNIGNNTAKITGLAITDTISELDVLRQFIKDKSRNRSTNKDTFKFPNSFQEIGSFDSTYLDIEYTPKIISKNKFIVHILVFYENELNQLFDTYYWIHFNTNTIIIENPLLFNNDSSKWKKLNNEMFKSVDIKNENNYSEIYTLQQKEELIKNYKK